MTREEFNKKYAWAYDAMRDGKKCKFWDDDKDNCIYGVIDILAHEQYSAFGCLEDGNVYKNCELVKTEKWIKKPQEAMKLLATKNAYLDPYGALCVKGENEITSSMLKCFGTKLTTDWNWPDFLIEEREV